MPRLLAALSLVLLSAAAAPAQDAAAGKIRIRWHGQSFFDIVSPEGARIVLDPHALEAYGRIFVKADIVLMSHFHIDHTKLDAIENAAKAKKINALKNTDHGVEFNNVDEKFKDVHIRSMGTYHDTSSGLQRGKNGVFILEIAGLRIVHLGDLGHTLDKEQIKRIGEVDVLLIPVGGVYTINGLEAQKVVEQLKPKRYIIPMHYGTLAYNDLLDLKYFLEDQTMGVEKKFATNELVIDPKEEAPKEPIIAVLGYEDKDKKPEK
jgi:L-ascorbate metabolism protein UlaG (beta-lactamase superfamily)